MMKFEAPLGAKRGDGIMKTSRPQRSRRALGLERVLRMGVIGVCLMTASCVSTPQLQRVDPQTKKLEQAQAIRNIGLDHLNNWRTAMAIRELRRAEKLNPDDVMTLVGLAEGYQRRKHYEDSERYLNSALALDPGFHEAYISYSNLCIRMERYEDSIQYSNHLVADPTFAAPWRALTNRGYAELKLGRLDTARRSFEEALEFRGYYGPAWLSLGIVEAKQGRRLEAIERFEWVMEQEAGESAHSEAAYRMGEIYVSMGHRQKAVGHFAKSAELAPYGMWGRRSKDYLKLLR
jgi:Tfp pilus assembly protein PilF